MTNEERVQMIAEAIELVEQAMQMVDEAIAGTGEESRYDAYGKYGFNQLLGNGNPYDNSLQTLMNVIGEENDEE